MCKKQTAVSHSSAEAEVISLDAGLRMEGLPALMLWDQVIDTLSDKPPKRDPNGPKLLGKSAATKLSPAEKFVKDIDYTPYSLPITYGLAKMFVFEDNEAVIKMVIKGRSPNLRHVPRTQRVDLDWLLERINLDPAVKLKYVGTKEQLADILTKGLFSVAQWNALLDLIQIGPEKGTAAKENGAFF